MGALIAMRTLTASRQQSFCIDITPFPPSRAERRKGFGQSFPGRIDPGVITSSFPPPVVPNRFRDYCISFCKRTILTINFGMVLYYAKKLGCYRQNCADFVHRHHRRPIL